MENIEYKIENGLAVVTETPTVPAPIEKTYTCDELDSTIASLEMEKQMQLNVKSSAQQNITKAKEAIVSIDTKIEFWNQVKSDLKEVSE